MPPLPLPPLLLVPQLAGPGGANVVPSMQVALPVPFGTVTSTLAWLASSSVTVKLTPPPGSVNVWPFDIPSKALVVVGFMSSTRPMIKAHLDTHSFVHFLPGLHNHLDLPEVAALAAPRALLVQQCKQDRLFPPAGMEDSVKHIAAAFTAAGSGKHFDGRFYDEPHRFTKAMQDEAFDWFDKHLL